MSEVQLHRERPLRGAGTPRCVRLVWALAVAMVTASHAAAVVDPALVELDVSLDRLLGGSSSEDVAVGSLFGVHLDDPARITERIAELERQRTELEKRIAGLRRQLAEVETASAVPPEPADGESIEAPAGPAAGPAARRRDAIEDQLTAAELSLSVAKKRRTYLRGLEKQHARLTDASQRVLQSLGQPREGLRGHVAILGELGGELSALASRLDTLSDRARSGVLVGFVSEQESLQVALAEAADSYRRLTERLETVSAELLAVADRSEAEGRRVRDVYFQAAAGDGGRTALDDLFLAHLGAQRRLRKELSDRLTAPGRDALREIFEATRDIAPRPRQVATTGDARQVLDAGIGHRQRVDALLAAETATVPGWGLAFENEVVTLLAEQASAATRAAAYDFSRELVRDVRSEVEVAWSRMVAGVEARRALVPTPAALLTTAEGKSYLLRLAGLLVLAVAWAQLWRRAPGLTASGVRALARQRALRGRLALLVRWSGLIEAVAPSLVGFAVLWAALWVVGSDQPGGQLLRAVGFPLLLYVLGRQLLLGATRRLHRGRPALIRVTPETLRRLQRTYASLGLVVAVGAVLDGVAGVVIGAGRLVALMQAAVLLWVFVWAAFELLRWRVPLARAWAALTPDEEPAPLERRLAGWMEGTRLGFVLSPVALARVAGTPVARGVSGIATRTDFVQSLQARLLRRRSMHAGLAADPRPSGLPSAYLDAFPLHPILGEDDALLVPRDDLLREVTDQLEQWRESRKEGSLVLVGEKGSGKTTLAAQIAKRVENEELVQITVPGKPTSREACLALLGAAFGLPDGSDLEALTAALKEGPDRVVLLDEAHNVFLRQVDGYGAYDTLVDLVNATSGRVFWVLVFNSFTWGFLNESRGRVRYFRKLLQVPKWTPEEIEQLIRLRNDRTGFELRFDELLLSDERATAGQFELVQEAEGYFRLLWESSGGNPRIASRLWLSSLTQTGDNVLRVGLFREAPTKALSALQDDLLFALAAICQHENLDSRELARVLNLSEGFARFAMHYLSELGLLGTKDDSGERHTLSATHYRAVLRVLRSKHLLYE